MHRISDVLWETLHTVGGAVGRNNNAAFSSLFLEICENIKPEMSFEIGAHEATFSCEIKKKLPNVSAHAFEANIHVFNRYADQMPDGVFYINQAVGGDEEDKKFYIPRSIMQSAGELRLTENNPVSSLRMREAKGVEYETITCQCTTLDRLHEDVGWASSVLWIDVEGAIGDVIRGGIRTLNRSAQCLLIELEKRSAWAGQWLAADVVQFMEKMGFYALARDAETSWQYNQIFIRKDLLTAPIVELVTRYAETIARHPDDRPQRETVSPAKPPEPVRAASLIAGTAEGFNVCDVPRELGTWLVHAGLLQASEVERFVQRAGLPTDFGARVLANYPAAEPISSAPGVTSSVIVPADPPLALAPPILTYDGPCPERLSFSGGQHLPATLCETVVGRIFLGTWEATLILDRHHYFAGAPSQESRWVTPAFADAQGVLSLTGTAAIMNTPGSAAL